jgi:hypothetical protein
LHSSVLALAPSIHRSSRVVLMDNRIDFVYGPRSFVRIEFDEAGAITSRLANGALTPEGSQPLAGG